MSDSEKNSVIKFATAQIAKPYRLHNSVHASITSPSWYCNELVWAAYQYAGINIAPSYTDYDTILLGTTIYGTNRTINIKKEVYLSFGIIKKESSNWYINIFNPLSIQLIANYNTKMCFKDDAANWKNLKNIKAIHIDSHSYKTVTISENFFADAITASYYKNVDDRGERFITFATKLNTDKTLAESNICQIKRSA